MDDKERAARLKEQGNQAFSKENYSEAIECYSKALLLDPKNAVLYSNRAAAYIKLKDYEKALEDSETALSLDPKWSKAYLRKGTALLCIKRVEDAKKTFLQGLDFDPGNQALIQGVEDCNALLKQSSETRTLKIHEVSDDFECVLCMKLFYEPVTTPCGHTFCRRCLQRSLDHNLKCPMCRNILHFSADHPVNITLKNIIEKNFPEEYKKRASEVANENQQTEQNMPLFLLNITVFPGQSFPMHIFEPRYRLMLRRCMEGSHRCGLLPCVPDPQGGWRPCTVGTVLEISDCHTLDDGRSNINTCGSRRFKVLNTWDCDGYLCGRVEWLDDLPKKDSDVEEEKKITELLRDRIIQLASSSNVCVGLVNFLTLLRRQLSEMPTESDKFVWWLASLLPNGGPYFLVRQALLESQSNIERLKRLLNLFTNPHQ
jgi:Lon protease-like protein